MSDHESPDAPTVPYLLTEFDLKLLWDALIDPETTEPTDPNTDSGGD